MSPDKLLELHKLLTEYLDDPDWNPEGPAWALVDQARLEVENDLREAGVEVPEYPIK